MGDLIERLPETSNVRWTAYRKAAVVLAVRTGELVRFEACQRYDLSIEELREWEVNFDSDGIAGLARGRTTKRAST